MRAPPVHLVSCVQIWLLTHHPRALGQNTTISTLSQDVEAKVSSLRSLLSHLESMARYLRRVSAGELPVNHTIIYRMQDIFNLLPNTNTVDLPQAFAVTTNDMMVVVYLSSLIRAVIALHNLVNNKLENRAREMKDDADEKARSKMKAEKVLDKKE